LFRGTGSVYQVIKKSGSTPANQIPVLRICCLAKKLARMEPRIGLDREQTGNVHMAGITGPGAANTEAPEIAVDT